MEQDTGKKRNFIDKFYTNPEVVKLCKKYITENIQISKDDLLIEPSAGNGSFINLIKELSNSYRLYDILPENPEIIKQDFLNFDINSIPIEERKNKIHIIGNPPFGYQSNIALKFIDKCCEFADTISFILPASFKKEIRKKKIDLNYHLIVEENLPKYSFLLNNKKYDVKCILQIWVRKNIKRDLPIIHIPRNFIFVKQDENYDIFVIEIFSKAGKIYKPEYKTENMKRCFYIKFTNNLSVDENIEKLKNCYFDPHNTACIKNITKQELIQEFNKYL